MQYDDLLSETINLRSEVAALREALEICERVLLHDAAPPIDPPGDNRIFQLDGALLGNCLNKTIRPALTDTAAAAAQWVRVPEVTGDPDMPNLELCSFTYLADALRRRGATVTPAPHGGDFAAAAPQAGKPEPEPEDGG